VYSRFKIQNKKLKLIKILTFHEIPVFFYGGGYICTGRFIMYTGITKMYYRKTVGHVFTKPVQIEGTTQFFSPLSLFSS
jgi:hypothetical protein